MEEKRLVDAEDVLGWVEQRVVAEEGDDTWNAALRVISQDTKGCQGTEISELGGNPIGEKPSRRKVMGGTFCSALSYL